MPKTIMVLGASRTATGPSDALSDRLRVGAQLYFANPSSTILITGDDGGFRSDEISVMKDTLIQRDHVPAESILSDGHGYRTYESCKNAKQAGINELVIVTQRFHAARASYICSRLGIQTVDVVTADLQPYQEIFYFWVRDLLATFKAWIDINLIPPTSPAR